MLSGTCTRSPHGTSLALPSGMAHGSKTDNGFDTKFPTLAALLKAGTVWQEGSAYVGRASDGVVVQVGDTINIAGTERYLSARPNPKDW